MGASKLPKPKPAPRVVRDAHRQTTDLVRASLLSGIRYDKDGRTR